jgi:CubicO group peptidase (beta-lactamase class C family)
MIHVAKLHRRAVLGLAAGFIAQPLWNEPAVSAVQAPPLDGPLGAEAVGALLEQHKVPGASLAIIAEGELAATYGYGFAHGQRAVMPQTRFQAASISKIVNALAVLKLAEAGRIGLDDPVNKYLKSWKLPDNELTATSAVTVRMLLNHTGGTNVHGFAGYARDANLPSLREILDGQEPANTPAIRVVSPPGEAHTYSGGGTTVLQQMLIDVTGEAYALTLARMVLGPLGMSESSFQQPPDAGTVDQAAFGHAADGSIVRGGFHNYPEMAAAGLWTTPRDLCTALLAIMHSHAGQAGSFLDQSMAQAMLTRGIGQAGLGTFVSDRGGFYHGGSNHGFRALYVADPNRRSGIVAMTNGDNGGAVCRGLLQQVAQVYRRN